LTNSKGNQSADGRAEGAWIPYRYDGFTDHVGPIMQLRRDDPLEPLRFGLLVEAHHCNKIDICHGGVVMALFDISLGLVATAVCEPGGIGPTIALSTEFLRAVPRGSWIESRVTIAHNTKSLVFVRGEMVSGGEMIAQANAIFKRTRRVTASVVDASPV
jgi:acyl-coenzyme A thioesterase PaaI-like protein